MMTEGIPAARYAERLERAAAGLAGERVGGLLIGVGPELRWLTGYAAMPLERLTMLVVTEGVRPRLIVPRLEASAAAVAPAVAAGLVDIVTWQETEDPVALVAGGLGADAARSVLLVSDRLHAAFLLRLQRALPDARFDLASRSLRDLRAVKDAEEVALLRQAAHAADRVVGAIAAGHLIGRTEADVAREVRERLVAEGHDEAAFWIVAAGPDSASPHHDAADRLISPGEPIVVDIGGRIGGYGSDITRTLWVTGGDPAQGPDDTFRNLYAVLQTAQAEATRAARAGVACEEVDAVARRRITEAGYGDAFIHRTGHGIGLEGHEDPYIVAGNREVLRPGHAFSVEPGIYLEGRYGARIEDIVVCTDGEPDVLNETPRDLAVVSGL
jgi:Xaa-Pro aminopeptidase